MRYIYPRIQQSPLLFQLTVTFLFFFAGHLSAEPASRVRASQIQSLFDDLGALEAARRQHAYAQLMKMGTAIIPDIQSHKEIMQDSVNLEHRLNIERLYSRLLMDQTYQLGFDHQRRWIVGEPLYINLKTANRDISNRLSMSGRLIITGVGETACDLKTVDIDINRVPQLGNAADLSNINVSERDTLQFDIMSLIQRREGVFSQALSGQFQVRVQLLLTFTGGYEVQRQLTKEFSLLPAGTQDKAIEILERIDQDALAGGIFRMAHPAYMPALEKHLSRHPNPMRTMKLHRFDFPEATSTMFVAMMASEDYEWRYRKYMLSRLPNEAYPVTFKEGRQPLPEFIGAKGKELFDSDCRQKVEELIWLDMSHQAPQISAWKLELQMIMAQALAGGQNVGIHTGYADLMSRLFERYMAQPITIPKPSHSQEKSVIKVRGFEQLKTAFASGMEQTSFHKWRIADPHLLTRLIYKAAREKPVRLSRKQTELNPYSFLGAVRIAYLLHHGNEDELSSVLKTLSKWLNSQDAHKRILATALLTDKASPAGFESNRNAAGLDSESKGVTSDPRGQRIHNFRLEHRPRMLMDQHIFMRDMGKLLLDASNQTGH